MSDYLIDLTDVNVSYGNIKVLRDINLKIGRHEFVSVVGPTGCGKTTLLNMIAGVLQMKAEATIEGTALFNGQTIKRPQRDCGIVWQDYSLFPDLKVWENIAAGPIYELYTPGQRILHVGGYREGLKGIKKKALQVMEHVGLAAKHADKYPCELSGGMKQRVACGRSLINNPKALMEDEPHGALDPTTREGMQIFQSNEYKNQEKMTFFFITHDITEALIMASRLIVLSPFYKGNEKKNQGSTIVLDLLVDAPHPRTAEFQFTDVYEDVLRKVRKFGLDERVFQKIGVEHLTHPDAIVPGWQS